ncbi:hypothetical protein VM98_35790, partial [Streptomyces rubellomurinus subsp. indigoferus]
MASSEVGADGGVVLGAAEVAVVASQHGGLVAAPPAAAPALDGTVPAAPRRPACPFRNPRGTHPTVWASDHGYVAGTTDDATGLTNLGAREY